MARAMTDHAGATVDHWMERLAAGERAAFAPVFGALWPPVLGMCRKMLQHEGDAADAAQQALEKVFFRASDYEPGRPALPWALAIAAWECRTILRRRGRRREAPLVEAQEPTTEGDHDGVDEARGELIALALEAMGTLSEVDQETLLASYWDTAASDIGTGTVGGGTLRKRRERALVRLRRAFRSIYGLG